MIKVICVDTNDSKSLILNKVYQVKKLYKNNRIYLFDDITSIYSINRFTLLNGDKLNNLMEELKSKNNKMDPILYVDKRIDYKYRKDSCYICFRDYGKIKIGDVFRFKSLFRYWVTITDETNTRSFNISNISKYFYMVDESDYISINRKNKLVKIKEKC